MNNPELEWFKSPMAWWYGFALWIALILSILIIWWGLVESYRAGKRGGRTLSRMTWPLISLIGLLLQAPAVFISVAMPEVQAKTIGISLAALGVCGMVFVGVAMTAYFSKALSTGNTLFSRTKQIDSRTSSTSADRRRKHGAGGVAVDIESDKGGSSRKRHATPLPQSDEAAVITGRAQTYSATAATVRKNASGSVTRVDDFDDTVDEGSPGTGTRMYTVSETRAEAASATLTDSLTTTVDDDDNDTVADDNPSRTHTDLIQERTLPDIDAYATIADQDLDGAARTVYDETDDTEKSVDRLKAQLHLLNDENEYVTIRPQGGSFIVGRDSHRCSLAVSDSKTSRRHFAIEVVGGGQSWLLTDLGSSNGTFVNGRRIHGEQRLEEGDYIEFGRNRAQFVLAQARTAKRS